MVGSRIRFWTLRPYIIVASEFDIAIGGSSLANLICAFCVTDPLHPVPGPSQGGDSIVPFLYHLMVSSGSSSLIASSASALHHWGVVVCSGVSLGSFVPPPCSSFSSLSLVASFPAPYTTPSSSLPLVPAPGFSASASFAAPPPSLASLPPSFLGSSPSVALFHPSLPALVPPGFHLTPSVRPLAPPMGLRHHGPSFAPSKAPSFSVASLLSPAPGSSTLLPPSSVPAPPPFPLTPVPPPPYFPSVATFVSCSLPTVPTCLAPSFSSLASLGPSLAPPVFSLVPVASPPPPLSFSLLLLAPAHPSSLAAPLSTFGASGPSGFATLTSHAPVDRGAGASCSAPPSASVGSGLVLAGAAGSSDPDGVFLYHDFDDSSEKGESALGKAAFSRVFHEVVTLIAGFFPRVKPPSCSSSSLSEELIPWEDICGPSSGRDPRIFLSLFDKMSALLKQVNEKFQKAVDEKKTSSALPRWGNVYRLWDLPDFHEAPKLNESFLRLLNKPVASSRHVALSLEGIAKLETCVRGLVESQSFSLWLIATVFKFLKD